uniref:Glutamate decarboxylase 1b n=1 Tax=Sinocyclocheilus grahami TaxID=75366 RepID=A0A672T821_SINGR
MAASTLTAYTMQFLLEVVDILTNYVRKTFDRSTKVLDFHHPHQLLEGMEGFNLELCDQPESLEQILVDCRDTLKYGVRTGHPRFFNQLSSGLDIIGGAISNMYSVMVARYKHYPEVKIKGMAAAPRLVLFTSERVGHLLALCLRSPSVRC